jgi:hypothetical protein
MMHEIIIIMFYLILIQGKLTFFTINTRSGLSLIDDIDD